MNSEPSHLPEPGPPGIGASGVVKVLAVGTRDQAWLFPDDPFLNHGCRILRAATLDDARAIFDTQLPELVFLPLRLDGAATLADVKDWLNRATGTTIVVVANNDEINDAAEAMRYGAFDCLFTPFSRVRLSKTVEGALRRCRAASGKPAPLTAARGGVRAPTSRAAPDAAPMTPPAVTTQDAPVKAPFPGTEANEQVPSPAALPNKDAAPAGITTQAGDALNTPPASQDHATAGLGLIGSSPGMESVLRKTEAVARSDATVFIQGEHGTGKELLARHIHTRSARNQAMFVPLDCANLTPESLDRDLFGTPEGAPGTITRMARGGTLYLDEICNLIPQVQAQIMRFLQRCESPLSAQDGRAGIRIICSTARDPFVEMEAGRLRVDLFYRLHVATLALPPLHARGEDIVTIAQARLTQLSGREGRAFAGFAPDAIEVLLRHRWPGNVRQLLNTVWNVVLNHDGPLVEAWMLPEELTSDTPRLPGQSVSAAGHVPIQGRTLAQVERDVIEAVIQANGGSIPRAARALDVSPSTIYRKRDAWLRADVEEG